MCKSQLVHVSVWSCLIVCVMRFEERRLVLFCWPDWIDKDPLRTNSTLHTPIKQKILLRTDDEVTTENTHLFCLYNCCLSQKHFIYLFINDISVAKCLCAKFLLSKPQR